MNRSYHHYYLHFFIQRCDWSKHIFTNWVTVHPDWKVIISIPFHSLEEEVKPRVVASLILSYPSIYFLIWKSKFPFVLNKYLLPGQHTVQAAAGDKIMGDLWAWKWLLPHSNSQMRPQLSWYTDYSLVSDLEAGPPIKSCLHSWNCEIVNTC